MAQRDYIERGRSATRHKKSGKRRNSAAGAKIMLILAAAVLIAFVAVLYVISHNKSNQPHHAGGAYPPANGLPPKPEERWSYIKELENRQVTAARPVEPSSNEGINTASQLTEEQRQLLEQIQSDMRQQPTNLAAVPANGRSEVPRSTVIDTTRAPPAIAAKTPIAPPTRQPDTAVHKPRQPDKAAVEKKAAPKTSERWILQCGSFRSTDQAESTRAQLAFSGIEGRISTEGGWKRVVLGPYSSRETASSMLQRLRNNGIPGCIMLGVEG